MFNMDNSVHTGSSFFSEESWVSFLFLNFVLLAQNVGLWICPKNYDT